MDRYIDSVMIGSDRVDERVRLITRLCDMVAPLVGDLGPRTDELIRTSLLATMREAHGRPLDVVGDLLDRLSEAAGTPVTWRRPALAPGQSFAVGLCDGRSLTDFALGAAVGIDRDEVSAARDQGRFALDLPPAPPACTTRHAEVGQRETCVSCALVMADAAMARPRVAASLGVPTGVVMDRVVARAEEWQAATLRPRFHASMSGPLPWVGLTSLSA